MRTLPPLLAGGVRFAVAGALMYAFLLARGGFARVRPGSREILGCAVVGTGLVAGGNGLVMVAEDEGIASGLAALVVASVPLWVVLWRRLAHERVRGGTLWAVAIGFAGVALLALPGVGPGGDLVGFAVVTGAAISWSLGSFLSNRLALPRDPLLSTAFQMTLGGGVAILAGLATGELGTVHIDRFSGESLAAFAYLVAIGSLVAFTAYVWLLQHAPISRVATYAYVNPLIAVALGALVVDEPVTVAIVAGAALIVVSVGLTVRQEPAA